MFILKKLICNNLKLISSGDTMNGKKNVTLIVIFLISLFTISCSEKKSDIFNNKTINGIIDADNSNIQYVGRFDRRDPKKVKFDWPGVFIRAAFEGTCCSIRLKDGHNLYAVTVDDQPVKVLVTDTSTVYSVATNLTDSIHTILIQKRTEAFVGKGEFMGFILDDGRELHTPSSIPDRRIEFIGNSITCGYGVEGESASSPFKPETENATLSYAGLIGRALNADYAMVAYSGKGVVRNYGDSNKSSSEPMPSVYNRTCCSDPTLIWDYMNWIPQVVVINLGTNDFSTQPHPDKSVFQEAYKQLINRVQSQYPDVTVFCICGPLIDEPCARYIEEVVGQCKQQNANKKVFYIGIKKNLLNMSDMGSDWHPNIQGQRKIADVILPKIQDVMNW